MEIKRFTPPVLAVIEAGNSVHTRNPFLSDKVRKAELRSRMDKSPGERMMILYMLAMEGSRAGVTKYDIADAVYGLQCAETYNTIRVNIKNLRRDINPYGLEILCMWGYGIYLLTTHPLPEEQLVLLKPMRKMMEYPRSPELNPLAAFMHSAVTPKSSQNGARMPMLRAVSPLVSLRLFNQMARSYPHPIILPRKRGWRGIRF